MGACILPGVTIGDSFIVGAGSVVVRDLDAFTVAVGNPAERSESRASDARPLPGAAALHPRAKYRRGPALGDASSSASPTRGRA